MGYRIQNRRDTAARWAEMNPILLEGEIGLVTDNANQYKVGDGIHAWNDLPLRGFTGTISQELGEDENAVVSQKVVTEKLVETEGKLAELGSETRTIGRTLDSITSEIVQDKDDKIYITDANGNVLAEIGNESPSWAGIKTLALKLKDNNEYVDVIKELNNRQKKEDGKGLSSNDFTDEVKRNINTLNFLLKPFLSHIEEDSFNVCDSDGNLILKVDKEGLSVTNIKVKLNGKLVDVFQNIVPNDKVFAIADVDGNIAFSIDNKGNIKDTTSWMCGKNMYVLGDSLSAHGQWMTYLSKSTGAIFDQEFNASTGKPISAGGTRTGVYSDSCGMTRIKNLKESGRKVDILFIQNINDKNILTLKDGEFTGGSITDSTFFCNNSFYGSNEIFNTGDEARAYWDANAKKILQENNAKKMIGSVVLLKEYGNGGNLYKLKVTGKATSNGTFYLKIYGTTYGVNVDESMSIKDITDKIEEWAYGIIKDTRLADDEIMFSYGDKSIDYRVEFVSNGTGVSVELSTNNESDNNALFDGSLKIINTTAYYYVGKNADDWDDLSMWTSKEPSLYSQYKGLLSYICSNFKDAKLFWVVAPSFSYKFSMLKEDGSYDIDSFTIEDDYKRSMCLMNIQKEVSQLYNVEIVDVNSNWGINGNNAMPKFFRENNVHPNDEGYKLWAITVKRLINA